MDTTTNERTLVFVKVKSIFNNYKFIPVKVTINTNIKYRFSNFTEITHIHLVLLHVQFTKFS